MKTLSNYTKKTLGSGNLKKSVALPLNEDINEWLAANLVDFLNEVTLLYSIVAEVAPKLFSQKGTGFPPGFEYRWAHKKSLVRCRNWEYCELVIDWVEDQVNNEELFPTKEGSEFPGKFNHYVKDIFKKLFRVYAILYTAFFKVFEQFNAARHLNTSFKHFMYFTFEFKLLRDKESKALDRLVQRLLKSFVGERRDIDLGWRKA